MNDLETPERDITGPMTRAVVAAAGTESLRTLSSTRPAPTESYCSGADGDASTDGNGVCLTTDRLRVVVSLRVRARDVGRGIGATKVTTSPGSTADLAEGLCSARYACTRGSDMPTTPAAVSADAMNADSLLPVSRRRTSHVKRTDPSLSAQLNILCPGSGARYCRVRRRKSASQRKTLPRARGGRLSARPSCDPPPRWRRRSIARVRHHVASRSR
jgi:hypothetical protein